MDPTQPTDIQPERRGWFGRNWKWFVPTGCLTFVLIAALLGCGIFFVFTKATKASDAYQTAFDTAKDDPRVIAALGKPIDAGLFCFWINQCERAVGRRRAFDSDLGSEGQRYDLS